MSDDITRDDDFAESQGIWWAGIAFASIVTFAIIGGLLIAGTYILSEVGFVDIPYWLPTATAAVLTVLLVSVSVKRGEIKYDPQ